MSTQTNKQLDAQFIAFLSEALPYIDSKTPTDINKGGCGVFAKIIYDKLIKLGYKIEIIAIYYDKDVANIELPSLQKALNSPTKENIKNNKGEDHIVLLIDDKIYVDSRGIVNAHIARAIKQPITRELLELILNHREEWNKVFDRDCIPTINSLTDEVFNNLDNYIVNKTFIPVENLRYTDKTIEQLKRERALLRTLTIL